LSENASGDVSLSVHHSAIRSWALALLLIATVLAAWSRWPPVGIEGRWVDTLGEIWDVRHDGNISTTNTEYPNRSWRWNTPDTIHLFYDANQQSPQGGFLVSLRGNTLSLTPAWRGRHGPWVFHRIFSPTEFITPAVILIAGGVATVYLLLVWKWLEK
jgi:hypothetical protein